MPTSVVESQVYIVGHYFPQWAKCFIKAPRESLLDQGGTTVLLTEPSLNSDNQRLAAALLGAWLVSRFPRPGWDLMWLRCWTASVLKENADRNETALLISDATKSFCSAQQSECHATVVSRKSIMLLVHQHPCYFENENKNDIIKHSLYQQHFFCFAIMHPHTVLPQY